MFHFKQLLQSVLILCAVTFGSGVQAHAVVTESTLKIDPIKPRSATQIKLTFNSNVELELSKFYLVSKGDEHTDLNASKGSLQGQIAIDIPALEPGEYALRFRVFAADGHLTEEVIPFSVTQ
ncbi:MAG: copper resistance CopC family protein [Gammaproteobacteria bacterium]